MDKEIAQLENLRIQLKSCQSDHCRLQLLDGDAYVSAFMHTPSWLRTFLSGLSIECELVIKSLIALRQEDLFEKESSEEARSLLEELLVVESFYKEIGGIVGYHCLTLTLLKDSPLAPCTSLLPPLCDISSETEQVADYILAAIRALPQLAELYPVGGAADRLQLIDPHTKIALPAAQLRLCGKTLLEHLIADVQAREYLYYKLFSEQITIPIAMMTSQEKDNHRQILSIFESNRWFGRPRESFHFFCQPAVPLIDKEGKWVRSVEGKMAMKPGGHGVIWKMAVDCGLLDAWQERGISKILVRQINNPIAGCDYGLLAFIGIGTCENKAFGFASCPRQTGAAEGINVLLAQKRENKIAYCLTNVEYCDFKKRGITEESASFLSNTNILFADIASIKAAVKACPIPGMIVNVKKMPHLQERFAARLESTMQNIADCFFDECEEGADWNAKALKTFLTYNTRVKTISTTKREYISGKSLLETPEGCFYDLQQNAQDLLQRHCHFTLPALPSPEEYLHRGPSFIFLYHPALGPLYSIIRQKLRGGHLTEGSELQLDIAEIDSEELHVQGSLIIKAEQVMGHMTEQGLIQYSANTGKCILRRVSVRNGGIDRSAPQYYWKNEIVRNELCEIIVQGNSEFIAEDVTLYGNRRIVVQEGFRVRAVQEKEDIAFIEEKINTPSWGWRYTLARSHIMLQNEQGNHPLLVKRQ